MADVVIETILKLLVSIVEEEVNLVYGVKKSVTKLTSNFQAIRAVIADAERKQMEDPHVRQWVDKLKVVSYKIEDVLDEWNTAILKAKIRGVKKPSITVRCFKPARKIGLRRDIAVKINYLNDELDVIADERNKYSFQSAESSSTVKSVTSSVINVLDVVGRVDDKEKLINLLSSECDGPNLSIISVIGMGGIGKTTLAQFAYNDQSIRFDERMWVCVSDPFDEIRVAKAILEALIKSTPNLNELDLMLRSITEHVLGKKILLVLDDVWCQKYDWCQKLQDSLMAGCLPGSKILVTTRNEGVANAVGSENFLLGVLRDSESQDLFNRVTFHNWTDKECENVEDIAHEIVKKCKGLPLALKTMGGFLRMKKSRREWSNVLESDLWRLAEERDVFPPLLLSYNDLSPAQRMCFLYCAVFPKDYQINRINIINLWMAQGYLVAENNREMEAVGDEYFSELAMRSFFQDFEKHDGTILHCKMHDIVHDFAQYLTKNECLAIEVNDSELETSSYANTRHLMVIFRRSAVSTPISLGSLKSLRTLKITGSFRAIKNSSFLEAFGEVIDQLTSLRTLDLSGTKIEKIPREVGKLLHLRYLNLEHCWNLKELPKTVWDLCNLLILNVHGCHQLKRLPDGLGKLINLRRLVVDDSGICILPRSVDKLMFLQYLNEFVVSSETTDKNDASSLFDLMNLNQLRGELRINGLGYVRELSGSKKAILYEKKYLTELSLDFEPHFVGEEEEERRRSRDVEVLEALQPHPYLQHLHIWFYKGSMAWPDWMTSSMTHLKYLNLDHCRNCEVLPPLGKLPSLETLFIRKMVSMKRVGVEFLGTLISSANSPTVYFPKLEMLKFDSMNEWEEWDDISITSTTISIMPRLQALYISNCEKLKTVPDHILNKLSLHTFNIRNCPILKERLIQYFQRPTHPNWVMIF